MQALKDSFMPSLIKHRKLSNYFMKLEGIYGIITYLIWIIPQIIPQSTETSSYLMNDPELFKTTTWYS